MEIGEWEFFERDHYSVIFRDTLTSDFCKHVIEKFESDESKRPGHVGDGYIPELKDSIDLPISQNRQWMEEEIVLNDVLHQALMKYTHHFASFRNTIGDCSPRLIEQTFSQVQKTVPGGKYDWHSDIDFRQEDRIRMITYLWYLNDVEDGYTEFCSGERIYPERGKLILFPSTWDRIHRGTPPKSDKYVCTGWMYTYMENVT